MVSIFFRAQRKQAYSIESLFKTIIDNLPRGLEYRIINSPYVQANYQSIVSNIKHAKRNSSQVNHITGDVHYLALGLPRKLTILTIHDLRPLERGIWIKRVLIKFWWFTLPVWWVKYITVISEATKTELLKHVNLRANKVQVIPNCLSPVFTHSNKEFNKIFPRILHLGTKENKNLERLIVAIKDLPCCLVIVGVLTNRQLQLLIDNSISYFNLVNLSDNEILMEYQLADLVSFISLYEGFGMPIIEAQATGRPVITSNVSSMPEVGGNGALYVNPESVEEIRAGILELINNPDLRNDLVKKGLENVKRFSAKAIAQQYADLYANVLAHS